MIVYLSLIIIICLLGLYINENKITKNFIIFLITTILICIYAFRYYVGSDFFLYHLNFVSQNFEGRDWLFNIISKLNYNISNGNWYYHSLVLGLITYVPIIFFYKKYSSSIIITILIYIFSYSYFFPFNGIRQGIAIAIYIMAYQCLIDDKKIKFVIYIICAYLLHSTVLIAIPFMILSLAKYNSKLLKLINILLIICVAMLNKIWPLILSIFDMIGQHKIANDYKSVVISDGNGSSFIRLLVYIVPVILGIYYYKSYKEKRNISKFDNVMLNTQVFACILMFASTKYWIFSRVALYFSIFSPIAYVKYTNCFKDKSKSIYILALLSFYFMYMILLLLNGEGSMLPYQNFLGWKFK